MSTYNAFLTLKIVEKQVLGLIQFNAIYRLVTYFLDHPVDQC